MLQKIGNQFADVIGEVHILGKSINDAVNLGQRRSALEGEFAGQRRFIDGG